MRRANKRASRPSPAFLRLAFAPDLSLPFVLFLRHTLIRGRRALSLTEIDELFYRKRRGVELRVKVQHLGDVP